MKNLFFYGTLAHRPLLEVVLGRALSPESVQDANLPDFAPYWVKGQAHPVLAAQKGAAAKGLYLTGLSAQDVARLDFYEGG
ncbi:MAG: gamma-glutamylcyclotransferase, partial [Marinosulfonomonas sp.]|nr:gamma-glutamylcyclotransferase [Marinosulfonomonas sp.]